MPHLPRNTRAIFISCRCLRSTSFIKRESSGSVVLDLMLVISPAQCICPYGRDRKGQGATPTRAMGVTNCPPSIAETDRRRESRVSLNCSTCCNAICNTISKISMCLYHDAVWECPYADSPQQYQNLLTTCVEAPGRI